MKVFRYHKTGNSERYNPYSKIMDNPSKVIPGVTIPKFQSNSEIIITKIGANYTDEIINKESLCFKKNKLQQSVNKAREWVIQTTNKNACNGIKKLKSKSCLKYENKRVIII
jgi:hypothetical protein